MPLDRLAGQPSDIIAAPSSLPLQRVVPFVGVSNAAVVAPIGSGIVTATRPTARGHGMIGLAVALASGVAEAIARQPQACAPGPGRFPSAPFDLARQAPR